MNSFVKALMIVARTPDALEKWTSFLERLACIEKDTLLKKVLSHPELSFEQSCSILDEIIAKDEQQKTMIRLLGKAKLLHSGRALLQRLKALSQNKASTVSGKIVSDTKIDDQIRSQIEAKFSERINKKVVLVWEHNPVTVGFEAAVGSYRYSLTVDDVASRLNEVLLRG